MPISFLFLCACVFSRFVCFCLMHAAILVPSAHTPLIAMASLRLFLTARASRCRAACCVWLEARSRQYFFRGGEGWVLGCPILASAGGGEGGWRRQSRQRSDAEQEERCNATEESTARKSRNSAMPRL